MCFVCLFVCIGGGGGAGSFTQWSNSNSVD